MRDPRANWPSRREFLRQVLSTGACLPLAGVLPAFADQPTPQLSPAPPLPPYTLTPEDDQFLYDLESANFLFFWEQASPKTGMVKDRCNVQTTDEGIVASIAATGFGLTALCIAEKRGFKPIGRLLGWGISGCDPSIMGIGPAPAVRRALERHDAKLSDFDLFEVNEAFAPQYLAVEKELGLPRERTNVDGGAIAVGHPLAASGARITAHLLYELRRCGAKRGIGSACIGGGQGIALLVESA